jgi:uncharacterized protein (DUF779 family)
MSNPYAGLPKRVETTEAANVLLRKLTAIHGPLMFHQSGGCCDGSAPMCYPAGEFRVGGADVLLGQLEIEGIAEPISVWISLEQFEYWKHTSIAIDVVPGRGGGFSLETPEGLRFLAAGPSSWSRAGGLERAPAGDGRVQGNQQNASPVAEKRGHGECVEDLVETKVLGVLARPLEGVGGSAD